MKEKFFKLISKWRFWLSFQFLLILMLYIIGHIRAGDTLDRILGRGLEETFAEFMVIIIMFPLGIYFFFTGDTRLATLDSLVKYSILPASYYFLFFILVWYITKQKRNWKLVAIGLILFMILSFGGCSRVIEIPLYIP